MRNCGGDAKAVCGASEIQASVDVRPVNALPSLFLEFALCAPECS
jgi:hypothetical protein